LPFLSKLDELLTLKNENGYIFQASIRAHRNAEAYLEAAASILGTSFAVPEFIPDGEGGIDIEWSNGQKQVTLSCRATGSQRDYIYWEESGSYEAKDFTLALLVTRLMWLQ
jgi:hypothetical protein